MTYLVIIAHLLAGAWGTHIVCRWVHDRRVPRPDDVRAVQVAFIAVCVLAVIAVFCDLTDGGRQRESTRMFWEATQLLCLILVALVITVLRNSSLPRAGKG